MEKADNTTPSCEELAVYVEESIVSVTNTYEQSPVVLMVDDAVIGTLGNFSASIGKAKSKKTFNVSAIVASALRNSTVLHYRSTFPDNKRNILYIDTEQGRHHCQQILKRILRLAELPEDKKPDNLLMMALRKFSPKLRLAIVEQAIGTELNNKAETIMQVEVDKEDKTVSVVEAVHIRDREFEPFAFRINEEAMPEPVESYLPKEKKTGRPTKGPFDPDKEIPKNVHRPALDTVFANGNISNYDDYIERLKEGYGSQGIKLGYNKAVKVATLLSDKQMVIKEGKDYAFNPEYHY